MVFQVAWKIEFTEEFSQWWDTLTAETQEAVGGKMLLLNTHGPRLGYPHSSAIKGSRYPLRELRVQHRGHPLRILYVFDPRRTALLLLGGDKTGDNRWYEKSVPLAEKLYLFHVETLKQGD